MIIYLMLMIIYLVLLLIIQYHHSSPPTILMVNIMFVKPVFTLLTFWVDQCTVAPDGSMFHILYQTNLWQLNERFGFTTSQGYDLINIQESFFNNIVFTVQPIIELSIDNGWVQREQPNRRLVTCQYQAPIIQLNNRLVSVVQLNTPDYAPIIVCLY